MTLDRRAVRFPGDGHIWAPAGAGRRAAAAGIAMHSPCRPTRVLAQRALYLAVRLVGARAIPGRRAAWDPPLEDGTWLQLLDAWRDLTGPFDAIALYRRPQAARSGFSALLLRDGRGVGFARCHPQADRVAKEHAVQQAVFAARPRAFDVAQPLGFGRLGDDANDGANGGANDDANGGGIGGAWLLSRSLPNYPLGAVRRAAVRDAVAAEIGAVLREAAQRDAALDAALRTVPDVPAHWRPAHGDLAPWNLRTTISGSVRVIDWEDAAYAPPGVDRLYGALTAHATYGAPLPSRADEEALEWVRQLILRRCPDPADPPAAEAALLRAIAAIRGAGTAP